MKEISFNVSAADRTLITQIAVRAMKQAEKQGIKGVDVLNLTMDLTATHANGTPLRLAELLAADDGNFGHDVWGIRRYLDRSTGQLMDHFLPRFALPTASVMGRKGGAAKTEAKTRAVRENGKKGGRPRRL